MIPNLYLAVRKIVHPNEWEIFNGKKNSEVLIHQTTPVPGIYCINKKGKKFLVAMQATVDRPDNKHIFKTSSPGCLPPVIKYSLQNDKPRFRYRVLRDPLEVQYCKILNRYMFRAELENRWEIFDHRNGSFSHMFRLDNPSLYIKAGRGKFKTIGEVPKPRAISTYHSLDCSLWFHHPGTNAYKQLAVEEAQKAKKEIRENEKGICYQDESETYMKVLRYYENHLRFI